jgi:hypothetical protein
MSVYSLISANKGVFNLPKEVSAIDVTTRNAYNATIIGFEAGVNNQGAFNVFIGYRAGNFTSSGGNNVFIGAETADRALTSTDNVIVGTNSARRLTSGRKNVYVGNNVGYYLNGNNNILVGFNNTSVGDLSGSHSNIGVGYNSSTLGANNILLGNNSYMMSYKSIGIGQGIIDTTKNSIIVGNNIFNTGSNVLIINNRHNSNSLEPSLSNTENDYMNINDYIVVAQNAKNQSVLTFTNDVISLSSSNIEFALTGGGVHFGEVIEVTGRYSTLILGKGVTLGLRTDSNPNASHLNIESNNITLGGCNVNDFHLYGSNNYLHMNSNLIVLSNNDIKFEVNSNITSIGGSNNQMFRLYGSNNTITMSNGGTYIDSELVIYRDTFLSNNLIVNKTSQFKDNTYFYDDVVAYSNVSFEHNINVNSNSVIYVGSAVSVCNDDRFFIEGAGETHIKQPMVLGDKVYIDDKISFCNTSTAYLNWDKVNERELQEFYGSSIIQKNLFVGGMMYSAGINVADRLVLVSGNGTNQWNQYVAITSNQNPYLVFESSTGAVVKLGDDFQPEIFNFTGKHRCNSTFLSSHDSSNSNDTIKAKELKDLVGKIVIANGDYKNLQNEKSISIDEAIPLIELCNKAKDSRAFGVISDFENNDTKRIYRLGNLTFETEKTEEDVKVIVNSVGEGGIWVSNINGPFQNGDLIVSSDLSGFGMRQDDDLVRSYTVAKITCDCDFDFNISEESKSNDVDSHWRPIYEKLCVDGKEYIISFVGCTYKF